MRRVLWHPLTLVLALGVALRVLALVGSPSAWAGEGDAQQYIISANDLSSTFGSDLALRPAGYPVFLAALHAVWASSTLVIVVQQLLGLATAVLLYLTMRRVGASPVLSALAAAVVAISPDFIFFEQSIMSEAPFLFMLAGALYLAVLGLSKTDDAADRDWVWLLAGAGAVLAIAATFRAVGQVLVPLVAVVVALGIAGPLRRRALAGAAVLAPAIVLILAYSAAMSLAGGQFGLAKGLGWGLYTRMAPVADCSQFDPAPGSEGLCQTTDPDTRPGPDFYGWNPRSPARALFVGPPNYDDVLGGFGRRAIVGQPLDYAKLVATDLWRYVDEDAGPDRVASGTTRERYQFGHYVSQPISHEPAVSYYGSDSYEITDGGRVLGEIQTIVRVHGVLVLVAFLLALAGAVLARGLVRSAILLLGGTALVLVAFPVVIGTYNFRYGLVAYPSLVAAGLLGAWMLVEWVRRSRQDPAPV